MRDKILKLRLQNKSDSQIAEELGLKQPNVRWHLGKIYKEADAELQEQLDNLKYTVRCKEKLDLQELPKYIWGIIWGLGVYYPDGWVFRCKDRHFLDELSKYTDSKVYKQKDVNKVQYVLKTSIVHVDQLKEWGWTERWSDIRGIPSLSCYKDFLRSYIELYGYFEYIKVKTKAMVYKKPKIRIYGNKTLIKSITDVLHEHYSIPKKKPYVVHNGKTAYISYSKFEEIESIFEYIKGEPCHKEFWQNVEEYLSKPKIYL